MANPEHLKILQRGIEGWNKWGKEHAEVRNEESDQYHSCFISYSSFNFEFANRLKEDLIGSGVVCWFAEDDMRHGDIIKIEIKKAMMKPRQMQ